MATLSASLSKDIGLSSHVMPSIPWSKLRHDLRTPVNIIIGYPEILLDELNAIEKASHTVELTEIKAAGQNIIKAISQTLQPTRHSDLLTALKTLRQAVRSPTNAVLGYCDLLIEDTSSPLVLEDIQKIQAAIQTFRTMINRLETTLQSDLDITTIEFTAEQQEQQNMTSGFTSVAKVTTILPEPTLAKVGITSSTNQGRILVVDDQASNRELLTQLLLRQNYRVDTAIDGRQALQKVATDNYDLILLDVIMPKIDGYKVLRRLKADAQLRHIPVIMISALDDIDSVVRCVEQGAADYLPKPFSPVLLRARIGACLEAKKLRDNEVIYLQELSQAHDEITKLNQRLKAENLRMEAELNVAKRVQQMILPRLQELEAMPSIDIAGYMNPADEVGGDYYDVLVKEGIITIGIGDVTGHGLESGLVMLMAQTTILTLTHLRETDPVRFLNTVNATIYANLQRMDVDRNLTLVILNYADGHVSISGQHEEVLVVRANGTLEKIDTVNLGITIGMIDDIADFVAQATLELQPGDGLVLYTDGITESRNENKDYYGLERLCHVVQQHWSLDAQGIQDHVIADFKQFIGSQRVRDDITLLVLKQR